jgi:4a-hydroxytetrahydrobiopterin dehydratase
MSDELADRECVPCRAGGEVLPRSLARALLAKLDGWAINGAGHLEKTYRCEDFRPALEFVRRVGEMCEQVGHHGDLHLSWGGARLEVWTHKVGGLTESDFVWAAKADRLWSGP